MQGASKDATVLRSGKKDGNASQPAVHIQRMHTWPHTCTVLGKIIAMVRVQLETFFPEDYFCFVVTWFHCFEGAVRFYSILTWFQ